MLQGDTDNMVRRQKEVIPRLKKLISNIEIKNPRINTLSSNELSAIDFWLKEFRMSPPQIKDNMRRKEIIEILEEYISDVEEAHKEYGY